MAYLDEALVYLLGLPSPCNIYFIQRLSVRIVPDLDIIVPAQIIKLRTLFFQYGQEDSGKYYKIITWVNKSETSLSQGDKSPCAEEDNR